MPTFDNDKNIPARLISLNMENAQLRQRLARFEAEAKGAHQLKANHLKALNIIGYCIQVDLKPLYYVGAVKEISGYDEQDLLNEIPAWDSLVHPEDLSSIQDARQRLFKTHEAEMLEYRIIGGEGQIRWINDMAVPLLDEAGQVISIEGLLLEVTRRKEAEEELLDRQAHLNSILSSVPDVIWSVAPDTFELLYINPAAEKVYGYPLEKIYEDAANGYQLLHSGHELLLENFYTLLQRGWFEGEYCIDLPNGEQRWLNRRAHFAHDAHGLLARIDGTDTDITLRKKAEDTLQYISMHDYLTDLFNRFYFEQEMHAANMDAQESLGLIVCDVDGLKYVNDNMGHEAGDQLLIKCSAVLKTCFRQDEVVARIGGDEFTILIKNCTAQKLKASVEQLRRTIVDHNKLSSSFPLSLSIGHAMKSSPDMIMREVFRRADNMMYAEKSEKHRKDNLEGKR